MRKIQIQVAEIQLEAELFKNPTAEAIDQALPLKGSVNLWGDEIYFSIPVSLDPAEDAREEMQVGDLAYWPMGTAFCIFFGATPVSHAGEPRAYSPANPFGRITGDAARLRAARSGDPVTIKRIDPNG